MRKTISNKTTKERIFDAINEGFFLEERNCKRYIKKINPTYFDDEDFIHKFLNKIHKKNDEYIINEMDNDRNYPSQFVVFHDFVRFVSPCISKRLLAKKDFVLGLKEVAEIYTDLDKTLQLDPDVYSEVLKHPSIWTRLSDFPEELRSDYAFMHHFLNDYYDLFVECCYLNEEELIDAIPTVLLDKYDIVYSLLEMGKRNVFQHVSDRLRDNEQLAMEAVMLDGYSLQYVSDRLKDNEDIVLASTNQNPWSIQYASDRLKNDDRIVLPLIHKDDTVFMYVNERYANDYDLAYEIMKKEPTAFYFLSDKLQDNKTLAFMAVKESGNCFHSCSTRLRKNKDLVMEAIKTESSAYKYASGKYKNHFDSTWEMLKINPKIFRYASKKLRDDYTLAYEAVSQDYYNFRYVSDRLKDDITLARIAYKHDIGMIEYASERIRENPILIKL